MPSHPDLHMAARSFWGVGYQTQGEPHVCVSQTEVTPFKADEANILNQPAAGSNVLLIVNSHTQLSRRCLIFAPRLTQVSSLQTQTCLSALRLPFTSRLLFRTPSSFLIHFYPSMHPFPPLFFPPQSISEDLTHSYPSSLWENGSCSFSIIEGVQMPKYRCQ